MRPKVTTTLPTAMNSTLPRFIVLGRNALVERSFPRYAGGLMSNSSSAPPEFWDALARAKVTLGGGASTAELESAAAMLERARPMARMRPHALAILDGLARELQQAIATSTRGSGTLIKAGVVVLPRPVKKIS